ncbi:hypothetical protein LWM68_08280 [Niabella sp. W65]|nr:hypothetical protein [Niabella sp. W65]MCH7362761.1 hypothetical protein [Niabella sp. W65]
MKSLKKILDEWKAGKVSGSVTMYRLLVPNVQLLQLWPEYKPGESIPADLLPRIIYLILEDSQAVGAVEPQEDNLQAMMLTQWRAKGIFSKAMKESSCRISCKANHCSGCSCSVLSMATGGLNSSKKWLCPWALSC